MAIFTDFANYLKCKSYFEDTLGFHTLVIGNPLDILDNPNEEYVTQADYNQYGLFASMHNFKIAQNIWFLYGKSQSWTVYTDSETGIEYSDYNPPKEKEVGFELTTTYPSGTTDACGFLLDPAGSTTNLEFIGMKRLVPLPLVNGEISTDPVVIDGLRKEYKNIIQFKKFRSDDPNAKITNLNSYDDVEPLRSELNINKPNSLKITSSYDYDDFGKLDGKEYNVRQIGMLNLLHAPATYIDIVKVNNSIYNGLNGLNICDILNVSSNSIDPPSSELEGLDVHPQSIIDSFDTTDSSLSRSFLGILQFYINSLPNNRITYQTDYYNFILTFENKVKCSCTCENCSCNK